MTDNLTEYQLDNGLTVMLKEIHSAPIISCWIWYDIGSRNELPGKTGLSHWVEHMQFKGTSHQTATQMDHTIARLGGSWNAFTSPDWTTYFETLPANRLDAALQLESDRMTNSLFDPLEVETERTVILSEREGSENDPQFLLNEAVQNLAFTQHPYRNEVIGSKADLLALTREDLFQHYRNYYQPANARLCIAGDFSGSQAIDLVQQYFDGINTQPFTKSTPIPEDTLPNSELVELHGPGDTTFIQLAYRSPRADSSDFFAFTILESLLTGPSSLNMFGSGGISHRTSRLYLALVENEMAVSVIGGLSASIDPSTFNINLTAHPEHLPTEIIQTLDAQIESLQEKPVSQIEINRAVKQARALFAYGSDNITNQAFWMGYASSFARYEWFTNYVSRLSTVAPEDVMNVARKYLRSDARVLGIYSPTEEEIADD
ncbi:MAG: M16 family metallopeptidase [Anaerolineaceae bacterium]